MLGQRPVSVQTLEEIHKFTSAVRRGAKTSIPTQKVYINHHTENGIYACAMGCALWDAWGQSIEKFKEEAPRRSLSFPVTELFHIDDYAVLVPSNIIQLVSMPKQILITESVRSAELIHLSSFRLESWIICLNDDFLPVTQEHLNLLEHIDPRIFIADLLDAMLIAGQIRHIDRDFEEGEIVF